MQNVGGRILKKHIHFKFSTRVENPKRKETDSMIPRMTRHRSGDSPSLGACSPTQKRPNENSRASPASRRIRIADCVIHSTPRIHRSHLRIGRCSTHHPRDRLPLAAAASPRPHISRPRYPPFFSHESPSRDPLLRRSSRLPFLHLSYERNRLPSSLRPLDGGTRQGDRCRRGEEGDV
jgi:hypothetical protein